MASAVTAQEAGTPFWKGWLRRAWPLRGNSAKLQEQPQFTAIQSKPSVSLELLANQVNNYVLHNTENPYHARTAKNLARKAIGLNDVQYGLDMLEELRSCRSAEEFLRLANKELVLGTSNAGGGLQGAIYSGVIAAYNQMGLNPKINYGTSIGTIPAMVFSLNANGIIVPGVNATQRDRVSFTLDMVETMGATNVEFPRTKEDFEHLWYVVGPTLLKQVTGAGKTERTNRFENFLGNRVPQMTIDQVPGFAANVTLFKKGEKPREFGGTPLFYEWDNSDHAGKPLAEIIRESCAWGKYFHGIDSGDGHMIFDGAYQHALPVRRVLGKGANLVIANIIKMTHYPTDVTYDFGGWTRGWSIRRQNVPKDYAGYAREAEHFSETKLLNLIANGDCEGNVLVVNYAAGKDTTLKPHRLTASKVFQAMRTARRHTYEVFDHFFDPHRQDPNYNPGKFIVRTREYAQL